MIPYDPGQIGCLGRVRRRTRPISKAILATPAECTDRIAGQRAPTRSQGPGVPLVLAPPRVSPAEQVQFFPASKTARGLYRREGSTKGGFGRWVVCGKFCKSR